MQITHRKAFRTFIRLYSISKSEVEENGTWRRRYNHELYKLFNVPNITGYIKVKRLEWTGHLIRTSEKP
jgi:hypothetical protein